MLKYYAFFFISIYLFSTTPFSELLKAPLLLEHFKEHQQWDKDLSVIGFLYMHYVEDDQQYADHDRDMEMPFKVINANAMSMLTFIVQAPQIFANPIIHFKKQKQKLSSDDFAYSSLYLSSIWQPPRA